MKCSIKQYAILLIIICMGLYSCSKSDIMYYEGGNDKYGSRERYDAD